MDIDISNEDSILNTIKKLIGGIDEDCEDFDVDLLLHINGVIFELQQIGVGPEEGFDVTSSVQRWIDYIQDTKLLSIVKPLMYMKVKMVFDPPTGSELESMNRIIDRFEWRAQFEVEFNGSKEKGK